MLKNLACKVREKGGVLFEVLFELNEYFKNYKAYVSVTNFFA